MNNYLAAFENKEITSLGVMGICKYGMLLDIPSSGEFHIALYSIDGQKKTGSTHEFTAGLKRVFWKDTVTGNDVMILKISGENYYLSTKISLKEN